MDEDRIRVEKDRGIAQAQEGHTEWRKGDHNRDDKEAEGNSGITGHQAGTCAYISEVLKLDILHG